MSEVAAILASLDPCISNLLEVFSPAVDDHSFLLIDSACCFEISLFTKSQVEHNKKYFFNDRSGRFMKMTPI